MRFAGTKAPGDPQWWEWGPLAHAANTNKRGITLDLTRAEGHELALRLVCHRRHGVRELHAAGDGAVRPDLGPAPGQLNPQLNMVRMPAFGLDGPWRDRPGFAQTMESLTGMAAATGWPDGSPVLVGGAGDPIAGLHATFASLVALCAREEHGRGYLVEATMVEAALNAAAMSAIAYPTLRGGHTAAWAIAAGWARLPRGCTPAPERTSGSPSRSRTTSSGRCCAASSEIADSECDRAAPRSRLLGTGRRTRTRWTQWLADATRHWDAGDLAERLVRAGVPASVVIKPPLVIENPQIRHRGLFETEDHPVTSRHSVPGLPFSLSGIESWIRTSAPVLGQHNDEVLRELGVDEAERRAATRTPGDRRRARRNVALPPTGHGGIRRRVSASAPLRGQGRRTHRACRRGPCGGPRPGTPRRSRPTSARTRGTTRPNAGSPNPT